MNERIKLLKNQASVWCDENIPEQFSEETNGYGSAWEDKFAELIVRDCMEVASPNYMSTPEDSVYYVEQAIDRIAEHFGVEE